LAAAAFFGGSSGCTSRRIPSWSALRRTRSAWASRCSRSASSPRSRAFRTGRAPLCWSARAPWRARGPESSLASCFSVLSSGRDRPIRRALFNPRAFRTLSTKCFHPGWGNRRPEGPAERLAADGRLQAAGGNHGVGTPAQPRAPTGKRGSDRQLAAGRQADADKLCGRRPPAAPDTRANAPPHVGIPGAVTWRLLGSERPLRAPRKRSRPPRR
jgi:hypothetical protein